jgi:hypothetical protein
MTEVSEGIVILFGRGLGWSIIEIAKITESIIAWFFLGWRRLNNRRRLAEVPEIAKSIVAGRLWFSFRRLSKIRHFAKSSEITKGIVTLFPSGRRLLSLGRLSNTESAKTSKHVVTWLFLLCNGLTTHRF